MIGLRENDNEKCICFVFDFLSFGFCEDFLNLFGLICDILIFGYEMEGGRSVIQVFRGLSLKNYQKLLIFAHKPFGFEKFLNFFVRNARVGVFDKI